MNRSDSDSFTHSVETVAIPAESAIARLYVSPDLADAYSVALPEGAATDPAKLARFIFTQHSPTVAGLMRLRDALVAGFGLKTSTHLASLSAAERSARVGIFKVYSATEHEIVLGEDDTHLDFRLSVLCTDRTAPGGARRLIVSTVVHCHNRLGRLYIFVVAPFHRVIVKASLRRAARKGWPQAERSDGA